MAATRTVVPSGILKANALVSNSDEFLFPTSFPFTRTARAGDVYLNSLAHHDPRFSSDAAAQQSADYGWYNSGATSGAPGILATHPHGSTYLSAPPSLGLGSDAAYFLSIQSVADIATNPVTVEITAQTTTRLGGKTMVQVGAEPVVIGTLSLATVAAVETSKAVGVKDAKAAPVVAAVAAGAVGVLYGL